MKKTSKRKIAVALESDTDKTPLPRIKAKGSRLLAEKIIAIAQENNIPIVKDQELSEKLNLVELGGYLPEPLFPAVAEVIAHIHLLAKKHSDYRIK